MHVPINWWAVLVGGVSSMIIGSIYYADAVYGKDWKKLAKIDAKRFQKELSSNMVGLFAAALMTAYTVTYITSLYHFFYHGSWLWAGVYVGLLLWLGISATTLTVHSVLEQRPAKLATLALGNRFLSLVAMGLIAGWLHP